MNDYKVIQLITFFVTRFNYKIMSFGKTIDPKEVFLFNNDRERYPIIRISTDNIGSMYFNPEKVVSRIDLVKRFIKTKDVEVLNILINRDQVEGNEVVPTICLESDFASGPNVADVFPGIYAVIHDVVNAEAEVKDLYLQINRAQSLTRTAKVKTKVHSNIPYMSYVFMALGLLGFIGTLVLPYDSSINAILLGIAYKPLVVLNNEFLRCLTSTFISTSFTTLALNMLCLYYIGRDVENRMGHLMFSITFLLSGFFGNILWCIFGPNYLIGGMSSAIDGIFAVIVINAIMDGSIFRNRFFLFLIMFNIFANIQSGVYAVTSFGGAVVGLLMYFLIIYKNDKVVLYNFIGSILVLITLMCYKASTVRDINPVFTGTDLKYVEVVKNLGFNNYANRLTTKLIEFYGGN